MMLLSSDTYFNHFFFSPGRPMLHKELILYKLYSYLDIISRVLHVCVKP